MHIGVFMLAILIGSVLFDLDAWGIALAILIGGTVAGLLYGAS